MENDRGALPGHTVLPVIVGGDTTPHGGRANVAGVMVGNECLYTHELHRKICQKWHKISWQIAIIQ